MNQNSIVKTIEDKSRTLLDHTLKINTTIKKSIVIERPIPIHSSFKEIVSWFVALTVKDKIIGFLQFDSLLSFMRFSSLQRKPESVEECPDSKSWISPEYILARAKEFTSKGDRLEEPILTYDKNVARIAWLVEVTSENGLKKMVFVAGDFVYIEDSGLN